MAAAKDFDRLFMAALSGKSSLPAADRPEPLQRRRKFKQQMLVLPNDDKDSLSNEKWDRKREPGSFPWPSRLFLCGPPGSGKTNVARLITLVWAKPLFDRVIVVHCDPENSTEWDHEGVEVVGEPPELSEFEKGVKTALVFDDYPLQKLKGEAAVNVDRILGYGSTHLGITCLLCCQRPFTVPVAYRQYCNVSIVWPQLDSRLHTQTEDIVGLPRSTLANLFSKHCSEPTDSITIDNTKGTPWPLRKNVLEPLET